MTFHDQFLSQANKRICRFGQFMLFAISIGVVCFANLGCGGSSENVVNYPDKILTAEEQAEVDAKLEAERQAAIEAMRNYKEQE